MFLYWKSSSSLEDAAKWLTDEGPVNDAKLRTKIRRLYDIVNIYKSFGLVKKVMVPGDKPHYQWQGVGGLMKCQEQCRIERLNKGEEYQD